MHKQIFLALIFLVSFPAFAKQVVVVCDLNDAVMRAQFKGVATLEIANDNSVTGQIVYSTRTDINEALTPQAPQEVKGTLTVVPAGQIYVDEMDSFSLSNGDTNPLVTATLNTGTKSSFTSHIMMNREMNYISACNYQ